MELNEYQRRAMDFAVPKAKCLEYLIPGLAAEAGEVAGVYAKAVRKGIPISREKVVDELGDVLWFVQQTALQVGATLEEVAINNIEKLYQRRLNDTIDFVGKRCV